MILRLLLVLLSLSSAGHAQRLPFRNYTVVDGLPNEIVRSTLQDELGFLWFGTESGATRFDGVDFRTFDTGHGLAGNWVSAIAKDSEGNLWFACGSSGVSRIEAGHVSSTPAASILAICLLVDHTGAVWAAGDGVRRFDGVGFHAVDSLQQLPGTVFALFQDDQQRLWVGTDMGYGVYESVGEDWNCVARGGSYWVSSFVQDAAGDVWMGTDDGLKVFRSEDSSLEKPAGPPESLAQLADKWIRSLFVDEHGALWIGTNGFGVVRHTTDGHMRQFTVSNGLVGNNVLGITQDHEGNHWFATTTGVSKLATLQVETWSLQDGLVHNSVMCAVEDAPGDLWVGTVQGVSRMIGGVFTKDDTGFGVGDTFTLFSLRDRTGSIWLGSELGISRLHNGRFVTLGADDGWWTSRTKWNRCRSLWEDDRGWIWGANDRGLSVYKDDRFHELDWPSRPDDLGCAVLVDRTGSVWIGFHSGGGIFRFNVEDSGLDRAPKLSLIEHYEAPVEIPDGRVVSRELDREGNVWFGTRSAGALRFVMDDARVQRIDRFSTANGLVDDYVRCIMQDSRGTLWFGTNQGVQYMPDRVEGRTPFRHLGLEDGLPGSIVQFCYEDHAGDIWLCTSNGITRFQPLGHPSRLVSPSVYISGFSVLGDADSTALSTLHAELPHKRNSVAFEFVAVTYKSERRPRFRYMLSGLDQDWSAPSAARRVNYSHLPAGHYEFMVVAQNSDGLWSDTPAVFTLDVRGPFWRSWWFAVLSVLVLSATVYAGHRSRLRRAVEVERLRGRIAADLHDDLGSTLSSISIMSEIAMQPENERDPASTELLGRIHRDSRQMMEAMDDIVWAIRPQADRFETVVARMRQVGSEMLEPMGASFELRVKGDRIQTVRLSMETRRDMFLIFKEAVTNVARHAKCGTAHATLELQGKRLRLTIEDDGGGFPVGAPKNDGDGLANMRRRAAYAGGRLDVSSEPGRGTRIVLELPFVRRG